MADYYIVPETALTATADKIREKTGSVADIEFDQNGFANAISNITNYTNILNRSYSGILFDDNLTDIGRDAFAFCYSLTSVHFTKAVNLEQTAFNTDTSLVYAVFRLARKINTRCFGACSALKAVDILGDSGASGEGLLSGALYNAQNLDTLVIRNNYVCTLANINAFSFTKFENGKGGGTLYVPNSLKNQYMQATNWSTILGYTDNKIEAIEDSIYETQYVDGTPIGGAS